MLFYIFLICLLPYALGDNDTEAYDTRFLGLLNIFDHRVKFVLYTSPTTKQNITNANIRYLGNGNPFKFIVHGWGETMYAPYYKTTTEAYFKRGAYNVVHVDWSGLAFSTYLIAIQHTIITGESVGKLIAGLMRDSLVPPDSVHILGHSLGAHVAGVAGETVYRITRQKIGRITALDPAGPMYDGLIQTARRKLNRNSAKMVDSVHTDGGLLGYENPIGGIDFYPNGGKALQPGCLRKVTLEEILELIAKLPVQPLPEIGCSHRRSTVFFAQSINTRNIPAVKCTSWKDYVKSACVDNQAIPFGEDAPPDASGSYFLAI